MKTKAFLAISFLVVYVNDLSAGDALAKQAKNPRAPEVAARIVKHGIFQKTTLPVGSVLISDTDRIPARVGVMFGMRFEISNLRMKDGELLKLTKTVSHPKITKPNGEVSLGSTINDYVSVHHNTALKQVGYIFEHSYELVSGIWSFEMKLDGKTLVKQEFEVVKE